MFPQREKWDQTQCSYCGKKGRQFICWECHESDINGLREEMKTLQKQINVLQKELAAFRIVQGTLLQMNGLKMQKKVNR